MKALLFSDTQEGDYTCQLPVILATGNGSDSQSITEAFSDELALLMDGWDGMTFHLWGTDSENVEGNNISFAEVVEKFLSDKCGELSVDIPASGHIPAYTVNFAIRDVPDSPRHHLVKSGKEDSGVVMTPSIVFSGSEEACKAKMGEIKEKSCEHFDGGNGHWECLDGGGDYICYDIVEE